MPEHCKLPTRSLLQLQREFNVCTIFPWVSSELSLASIAMVVFCSLFRSKKFPAYSSQGLLNYSKYKNICILISVLWCKSITFQCKLCKVHQNIRNCKSIQPMFVFWTFITKIYLHHSNAIHFLAIGSNFWCKFYKIYVPAKCNMFLYPKDA